MDCFEDIVLGSYGSSLTLKAGLSFRVTVSEPYFPQVPKLLPSYPLQFTIESHLANKLNNWGWNTLFIASSEVCSGIHFFYMALSVQFNCSVMADSLQPRGLQHTRLPCPSATPGVYSNSCPLSQWCHPTISSSVIPFSSCVQSFPASGSFQMSQFFPPGGQSTGLSASASVLAMNIQDWLPLGWTGWISLQSTGLLRVFSNTAVQKHQFIGAQLSLYSNSHIHTWLLEKP